MVEVGKGKGELMRTIVTAGDFHPFQQGKGE